MDVSRHSRLSRLVDWAGLPIALTVLQILVCFIGLMVFLQLFRPDNDDLDLKPIAFFTFFCFYPSPLFGWLWAFLARRAIRGRKHERGFCQSCGYNLAGNVSGICPECGTLIPEDVKAMLRERRSEAGEQPV